MPIEGEFVDDEEDEDEEVTIATNALGPKRVTVDGQTVEQHSIADQILADKYGRAQSSGGFNLQYRKFVPPGSV